MLRLPHFCRSGILLLNRGKCAMNIGVPKEIKKHEYRVALLPVGAAILKDHNHRVFIQSGAGVGSGFSDKDYKSEGAKILETAQEVYNKADLILYSEIRLGNA